MTNVRAVHAVDVTKRYGDLVAVNRVSLSVEQGEVYGVLGPNGAGKTTFLRMLFGLIRADSGVLEVLGRTWPKDGIGTLESVAGFIESPRFYPYLSGRRNLELLAALDGGSAHRIAEVIATVDLTGRESDKVKGYSFGMRQRLGVASALLREPRLLVLDEPANGLDPAGIRDMRALVRRLAAQGLTVLLSSHDMAEVEEICDNVTIMQRGTVAYHGTIATLRQRTPTPAHRLSTADDATALAAAAGRPGLRVASDSDGLIVHGEESIIDAYILDIVTRGVRLRSLTVDETPLEELFFMLTEADQPPPLNPPSVEQVAS